MLKNKMIILLHFEFILICLKPLDFYLGSVLAFIFVGFSYINDMNCDIKVKCTFKRICHLNLKTLCLQVTQIIRYVFIYFFWFSICKQKVVK